jgi:hypothetical protein
VETRRESASPDLEPKPADGAKTPDEAKSDLVPGNESAAELDLAQRARAQVVELAAALDPEVFDPKSFEMQARAVAGSAGSECARRMRNLAGDTTLTAVQKIAVAEILRHVDPPLGEAGSGEDLALPAPLLGALRTAWQERDEDPLLAAAAVRALSSLGEPDDRRAMLDALSPGAPSSVLGLACAGLSAARGDEAALEIAQAAEERRDSKSFDVALSALTAMATAKDRRLSPEGRAQCAEILHRMLSEREARGERPPRLLSALAVLDPIRAEESLLASLADARTSDAAAQSTASALAAMPSATRELDAVICDERIPQARRVLAAEASLRAGGSDSDAARRLLERLRDEGTGTLLDRRVARALEISDRYRSRRVL